MMLHAACCALAALAAALPAAPSPHPGWEALADDPRPTLEIDRRRIAREQGYVEVWVRARGERERVVEEFRAAGADEDAQRRIRDAFDHSTHLWSFHCEDRTHALAYSAYHARDGTLIRDFRIARRAYWPVQPDTMGARLLATACGTAAVAGTPDGDAVSR